MQDATKGRYAIFYEVQNMETKQYKTNKHTWRMCVISLMMIVLCTWKAIKRSFEIKYNTDYRQTQIEFGESILMDDDDDDDT